MRKRERSKLRRSALLHGAIFPRINAPLFAPNNPAVCLILEHRAQKPRHPAQEEKGQNCYAIFPNHLRRPFCAAFIPNKKNHWKSAGLKSPVTAERKHGINPKKQKPQPRPPS
jgi:hypothetical protein